MGEKIHSHYDNLKVSRDAPPEVIRAAYKTLSQKHHPDRHPDDPNAVDVMKIINGSYEILSDPVKRREHDAWLARKEREAAIYAAPATSARYLDLADEPYVSPRATHARVRPQSAPRARGAQPKHKHQHPTQQSRPAGRFRLPVGPRLWIPLILLAIVGVRALIVDDSPTLDVRATQYGPKRAAAVAAATAPAVDVSNDGSGHAGTPGTALAAVAPANLDAASAALRAATEASSVQSARLLAPNGTAWPNSAGYIQGEAIGQSGGHSQVTVDNARNDFGVFAKLTWLDSTVVHVPVRQFYIPAGASFTLSGITPGNYDIRYQNVTTGSVYKSESFSLTEQVAASGVESEELSITLYPVVGGSVRPVPITDADF